MIRYWLPQRISPLAAAQCQHPLLARLRGRGPWTATDAEGVTMLQRGSSDAWTPRQPGLGGLEVQFAETLPDFGSAVKWKQHQHASIIALGSGHRVSILPASASAREIAMDGTIGKPATEYGRLAATVFERMGRGDAIPLSDPDLLRFLRLALMQLSDLTEELCHAYGLITTEDADAIFDAAVGLPKAQAGDGG